MLQLGNFTFDIDDYPTTMPGGGQSLVAVEKYPGGLKSVQDFGAFDDPITIKGTFMYAGAVQKVEQLDALWSSGQPQLLQAPGSRARWVQITAFKPVYHNDFQIDYDITLEPLTASDQNVILYGQPQAQAAPVSTSTTSTTTTSSSGGSASSVVAKKTPQRTYIVKAGDSLWKIAARSDVYGNGSEYPKIVAANHIRNPNLIYPGQRLVIP